MKLTAKESPVQMDELEQDETGEQDKLVQIQMEPEPEPEPKIENSVGVYSLQALPETLKPQNVLNIPHSRISCLFECLETHISLLFSSDETAALKQLFQDMENQDREYGPKYQIILLDASNSANLYESFEKIVKIHPNLSKIKEKFSKELFSEEIQTIHEIYNEINMENSERDQSLFVFKGAKSFNDIKEFLPRRNCKFSRAFCHFLITTRSATDSWKMEPEPEPEPKPKPESEEWGKFIMFDTSAFPFDWDGVYLPSELPGSFKPVADFIGRDEILTQLALRFQNIPRRLPSAPPVASHSFTVISGRFGFGKKELLKKFLSTHSHLFSKIVLVDTRYPAGSLLIFAYNLGLFSESEIEGATWAEKMTFLHSEIIKDIKDKDNSRVLFVFGDAYNLEHIQNYLPHNLNPPDSLSFDVIVTTQSTDWAKEEDKTFYRDNRYDFHEIRLLDPLSLEETAQFVYNLLHRHQLFFDRTDLERSIQEVYKYMGGFPSGLKEVKRSTYESSRGHPEWTPKQHILNYLKWHLKHHGIGPCILDTALEVVHVKVNRGQSQGQDVPIDIYKESRLLFQILCIMDPHHLDFDTICYFSLLMKREPSFKPPPTEYTKEETEYVKQLLTELERDALIQVNETSRTEDNPARVVHGQEVNHIYIQIRIPVYLREALCRVYGRLDACGELRFFLSGSKLPHSSWTRPLDVPRLLPHILSLNESHTRYHGYYNEFLTGCIRNHLKFWKNPSKEEEIPKEERPKDKDYKTAKDDINKLLMENPDFKGAFGDFSQVQVPGFFLSFLFFLLFLINAFTDVNNAIIMLRAGYISYFLLSVALVILPYVFLCRLQYEDRCDFSRRMKQGESLNWHDKVRAFTGTFDSYFLRFWYIWKFNRETENLERGLLFERLCVLRANAEYHGIANAFMESLPQLLLQFPLYLLSYTEEYSVLSAKMRGSFFPYELSLVISFFSFGLALTKFESIYFGWNVQLFGIKLLGYRIIHLLINVAHMGTLVICSGILSFVFPTFTIVISLVFCLSASAWILSNTKNMYEKALPNVILDTPSISKESIRGFVASFHPVYVEKKPKFESLLKHEFVSARLGHDLLFLQRSPRMNDIVYLFLFLGSMFISAFAAIYCTFKKCRENKNAMETETNWWAISVIEKYSFFFILWLPVLFMWQVLRQLLHNAYLKYARALPTSEDNILEDPEGIFRYPAYSDRWIQKRLYYQMRQHPQSVFTQAWQQVEQTLRKFNEKSIQSKIKILGLLSFKLICKTFYVGFIILILCLVPYNITLLKIYSPISSNNSFVA